MQANHQHEDKTMTQLVDLSDEIGADDWTIPSEEITRRRLVKLTPRYKVYKADWFGDVMVYEPITRQQVKVGNYKSPSNYHSASHMVTIGGDNQSAQSVIAREEFRSKLNELCLSLNHKHVAVTKVNKPEHEGPVDPDQEVDSAYSSISSTPQYYTKNNQKHNEFEFPHQTSHQQSSTTIPCKQEMELDSVEAEDREHNVKVSSRVAPVVSPSPVILNRDSFGMSDNEQHEQAGTTKETDAGNYNDDDQPTCRSSSDIPQSFATSGAWFELNELRLIAHENFILFMGASIENSARSLADGMQQTTSLVMQTSHPKSVSLYDLLHQDRTGFAGVLSPISRFNQFTPQPPRSGWHLQRPRLTIGAKLNICQQVTDAMTYLHDKNIVHARLTSLNVYIEPNQRVKVSLIDTDERQIGTSVVPDADHGPLNGTPSNRLRESQTNHDVGSEFGLSGGRVVSSLGRTTNNSMKVAFNLPALTYLSPEIIRTIEVRPDGGVQMDTNSLTKQADVFSFGTLLFELFEDRFPFSSAHTAESFSNLNSSGQRSPCGTSKLFHSLDLNSPLTNTRLGFSYGGTHESRKQQLETNNWNGNIRASACELIYQIGSGQIGQRNGLSQKCPPLVGHIISSCWSQDPGRRPSFKQLRFE